MNQNLRLEVFSSNTCVTPVEFYEYSLKSKEVQKSTFEIIRGACLKLSNINYSNSIFENGKKIYAINPIDKMPDGASFELIEEGKHLLSIQDNKRVYEEYIKSLIRKNLGQVRVYEKYKKYSTRNTIYFRWYNNNGKWELCESADKKYSISRSFYIKVEIREDNKAYLWLSSSTLFEGKETIADLLESGENVIGLQVKNIWAKNNQTGTVERVGEKTVIDELSFGCSLKDYYLERGYDKKVLDTYSNDTPVVKVKTNNGSELDYYPQALKRIITRETLAGLCPDFSNKIDGILRRNMKDRMDSDIDFINDIGELTDLDRLSFEKICCTPQSLGLQETQISLPKLECGNGNIIECGKEMQVFGKGFYKSAKTPLKFAFLYPEGEWELLSKVVNDIFFFSVDGKYHKERDRYTIPSLLAIEGHSETIKKAYEPGDIIDYKRKALEFKDVNDVDIVIALVPNEADEDNPYDPFKKSLAELNIPSQMITRNTAQKFINSAVKKSSDAKWYLHNIVLGILGKTGGIPWVAKNMPGNVDCFVGLDVATAEKGIHFPACSVVLDRNGQLMGYFKPRSAQRGEKISHEILQDIFDHVILAYEETHGCKPKNIVIHRDGFSNEDAEWYNNYFESQDINYSIIEVRKGFQGKMLDLNTNNMNPAAGACLYNDNRAYLVTTIMKNKKGSPNPLIIEKNCGNISMIDAIQQVLYLTQLHVGSTNKLRLPITTAYADKICKNYEYVPSGQMENNLFFL